MSKIFLTPLGLLSAISDPVSASTGDVYFNSSSNVTRVYYGSAWVNLSASSTLATHANTASAISGTLVTGIVASATVATTSDHANTASAINALLLTGTTLPAAIVSSSLTGVGTLTNLTVTNTISGRAASATVATHAGTASSIAGSLVTGTVASATVANNSASLGAYLATDYGRLAAINTWSSSNIFNSGAIFTSNPPPLFKAVGGAEGGELTLERPATTSLSANISIDLNSNYLRIFENGANNRGAFIDFTKQGNSVGSEIWTTGNMFTGAVNTTISATAGVYGLSVSPGTTLNGCIIINRSAGTVSRTHNTQVNVALNGTTASNGFVRGYVTDTTGAIGAGGNVFLYYMAW